MEEDIEFEERDVSLGEEEQDYEFEESYEAEEEGGVYEGKRLNTTTVDDTEGDKKDPEYSKGKKERKYDITKTKAYKQAEARVSKTTGLVKELPPALNLPEKVKGTPQPTDDLKDGDVVFIKVNGDVVTFYKDEQPDSEKYVIFNKQAYSSKFYEYVLDKTTTESKTVWKKDAFGGKGGNVLQFKGDKDLDLEEYLQMVNTKMSTTTRINPLGTIGEIAVKYGVDRKMAAIVTEPGVVEIDQDVVLLAFDEKKIVFDGKNYIVKSIPKPGHKIHVPKDKLRYLSKVELMMLAREAKLPVTKHEKFDYISKTSLLTFMIKDDLPEWYLPSRWNLQYELGMELRLDKDGNIKRDEEGKAKLRTVKVEPNVLSKYASLLLEKNNTEIVSVADIQAIRRVAHDAEKSRKQKEKANDDISERIKGPIDEKLRKFIRNISETIFQEFMYVKVDTTEFLKKDFQEKEDKQMLAFPSWNEYVAQKFREWVKGRKGMSVDVSEEDALTYDYYNLLNGSVDEVQSMMRFMIPLLQDISQEFNTIKTEQCYRIPSEEGSTAEKVEYDVNAITPNEKKLLSTLSTEKLSSSFQVPVDVSLKRVISELKRIVKDFDEEMKKTKVKPLITKYQNMIDVAKANIKILKSVDVSISTDVGDVQKDLDMLQDLKFQQESNKKISDIINKLEDMLKSNSEGVRLKTAGEKASIKKNIKQLEALQNSPFYKDASEKDIGFMSADQIKDRIKEIETNTLTIDQMVSKIRAIKNIHEVISQTLADKNIDVISEEDYEIKELNVIKEMAKEAMRKQDIIHSVVLFKLEQRLGYLTRDVKQVPRLDRGDVAVVCKKTISDIINDLVTSFNAFLNSSDKYKALNAKRLQLYSEVSNVYYLLLTTYPQVDDRILKDLLSEVLYRFEELRNHLSLKVSISKLINVYGEEILSNNLDETITLVEANYSKVYSMFTDLNVQLLRALYALKDNLDYSRYILKPSSDELERSEMIKILKELDIQELVDDTDLIFRITQILFSRNSINHDLIEKIVLFYDPSKKTTGDDKIKLYTEFISKKMSKLNKEELILLHEFIIDYESKSTNELRMYLKKRGITIRITPENVKTPNSKKKIDELLAKNKIVKEVFEKYIRKWTHSKDYIKQVVVQVGKRERESVLIKLWYNSINLQDLRLAYELERSTIIASSSFGDVSPKEVEGIVTASLLPNQIEVFEKSIYEQSSNTFEYLTKICLILEFITNNNISRHAKFFRDRVKNGTIAISKLGNVCLSVLFPELIFSTLSSEKYESIIYAIEVDVTNMAYMLFTTFEVGKDPSSKRSMKFDMGVYVKFEPEKGWESKLGLVNDNGQVCKTKENDVAHLVKYYYYDDDDKEKKNKKYKYISIPNVEVVCYDPITKNFNNMPLSKAKELLDKGKITDPTTIENLKKCYEEGEDCKDV